MEAPLRACGHTAGGQGLTVTDTLALTQISTENQSLTSLWPTHTQVPKGLGLSAWGLHRKGKSLLGSALSVPLLTNRLELHNGPSPLLTRPCSPVLCCWVFSGCLRVWAPWECAPPTILSFPSVHRLWFQNRDSETHRLCSQFPQKES